MVSNVIIMFFVATNQLDYATEATYFKPTYQNNRPAKLLDAARH